MVNIAVLGYGVVGSGVAEVIRKNSISIAERAGEQIAVKKIADVRDFPGSPDQHLLTKNAEEIFDDESIGIIVETIGGAKIAYEFTKRALQRKKHVVTSNKELVANHGPELLQLAKENGVSYLFEASVGGGIPIIRPLYQCLAANEIQGITGILNGTTNYILTQMKNEGMNFAAALKEAQEKGYAEADPTADVEGHDACRKIAILSSIAYNEYVNSNKIYTEGISRITPVDMEYAECMNSAIKLVATSKRLENGIFARVSPAIVSRNHPLSNVEDVFNAIVVEGDAIGEAMFYGRGAGKLPTASAVVADIIDIVKHTDSTNGRCWNTDHTDNIVDARKADTRFFIRIKTEDVQQTALLSEEFFGKIKRIRIDHPDTQNELAFITGLEKEEILLNSLNQFKDCGKVNDVVNMIRVLE